MNSSREIKAVLDNSAISNLQKKEQKKIYSGRSILVLGGRDECEFKHFKTAGMKESERNKFYVIDIDPSAKPDLVADFKKPLNLVDEQFDIAMMTGCPSGVKDVGVFQNAYKVLKKQGLFLYSVGAGCSYDIYTVCLSLFDHVYFGSNRLLNSDASSINLYNGPYKYEYANNTSLGAFIIAFKGPVKKLEEIYHESPNFKYIIDYAFFKGMRPENRPKLQFESVLAAIGKGMGISGYEQKEEKNNLQYEIQIAMQVLSYNTRFFGGNYDEIAATVKDEIANKSADLSKILALLVKLSLLLPYDKISLEQNISDGIELAEQQNTPLKNCCLDYINTFLSLNLYKMKIEKPAENSNKEFDAVITKFRR